MITEITDTNNAKGSVLFDAQCATNIVFIYLPAVYLLAAWKGVTI